MKKRPLLAFLAGTISLGLGACNNSGAAVVGVTPSTAVQVDPAQFLGAVRCGSSTGDMQLYVATISDVSSTGALDEKGMLVLPSAAPTSCHVPVLFENIREGRSYWADVDGYDRNDIQPLSPGSRVMVDTKTLNYVAPRWTTGCGHHRLPRDAGAVVVYADTGLPSDGGGYIDCKAVALSGPRNAPYLDGPVCAQGLSTITVRGCDALH